jgi:hypothetical protein
LPAPNTTTNDNRANLKSGGQKRRVSLAAALVHSPPLLILDEPTVGVDPLLRQSIWQHLVAMTKTERISVIITTHYIEEARLANVVGLMRNGRILAEDSPDELMHSNGLSNLEDVFLKLCVTDSSRRAAQLAGGGSAAATVSSASGAADGGKRRSSRSSTNKQTRRRRQRPPGHDVPSAVVTVHGNGLAAARPPPRNQLTPLDGTVRATVRIHTGTNKIELNQQPADGGHFNEAIEVFSSEEEEQLNDNDDDDELVAGQQRARQQSDRPHSPPFGQAPPVDNQHQSLSLSSLSASSRPEDESFDSIEEYLDLQQMHWEARRANMMNLLRLKAGRYPHGGPYLGLDGRAGGKGAAAAAIRATAARLAPSTRPANDHNGLVQWWKTLMAVTWKNYVRLRRNPPVLVFQFMLPAIQVILFCLCIGGEPFDVPVAVVNEESVPKSSLQFLNGLNKKVIRQIKYDNLTSAIDAVKKGHVWGAIHIPDKYSENLQSRLIMGEEVTNETLSNGTIRVYPDLTSKFLILGCNDRRCCTTRLLFVRDSSAPLPNTDIIYS